MTFLRKLALCISSRVIRWASPECKEWAEGQSRELAFISSDWAALRWSLGSLRILFRNPPKPLGNAAEIARAGRLLAGAREHTPAIASQIMGVQAISNGLSAVLSIRHSSHIERAGFATAALSAAYLAAVLWMESRMSKRPEDMDDDAWAEFYRREMTRLRDLYANFGALLRSAVALMLAGMLVGYEGFARPILTSCLIAFCIFVVSLIPRPTETFQRKLDGVDSILQQGGRDA